LIVTATKTYSNFGKNAASGWTAGGGLEWMFAPNWTTKLEYLYYDLGSASYTTGAYDSVFGAVTVATRTSTRFEGNIVRVGLNYKFGTGPILANY
jgi:outer membrane immunogenic protein